MNRFREMLMSQMRGDGRMGGYGRDYGRGGYRGSMDFEGDYARRDYGGYGGYDGNYMGDGRQGVRGTGPYGMGGSMYRDRGDMRLDYGEEQYGRLSERDLEKWKREIVNEDGSRGEHFNKDQIEQMARRLGMSPDELGRGVFCMTANMMYSDYYGVAKKYGVDNPDFYADMAKAFLKDKDFDGTPEEKLYLYYKSIVEKN